MVQIWRLLSRHIKSRMLTVKTVLIINTTGSEPTKHNQISPPLSFFPLVFCLHFFLFFSSSSFPKRTTEFTPSFVFVFLFLLIFIDFPFCIDIPTIPDTRSKIVKSLVFPLPSSLNHPRVDPAWLERHPNTLIPASVPVDQVDFGDIALFATLPPPTPPPTTTTTTKYHSPHKHITHHGSHHYHQDDRGDDQDRSP